MVNFTDVRCRNLSYTDLQKVMATCEQLHRADPEKSFVQHCQSVMEDLFSHVHFSAERQQIAPFKMLEKPNDTVDEKYLPLFYAHISDHPFVERLMNAPKTEIYITHDDAPTTAFRKTALYNEFYAQVESHNQIITNIVDGNELLLSAYSREQEYTEADYAILSLIQPHLELAWKHWKQTRLLKRELGVLKEAVFQSKEQETVANQLRKKIDALPSRQREVVEQVAAGFDNQQIADEMLISIRTVQKHLENIFHVLDVHHRTELAAQWHKAHSVQLY